MPDQPKSTLSATVAIVTSASPDLPALPVKDLLGDADPLEVLAVLARALHSTLAVAVGVKGRAAVLRRLGLDAAREES